MERENKQEIKDTRIKIEPKLYQLIENICKEQNDNVENFVNTLLKDAVKDAMMAVILNMIGDSVKRIKKQEGVQKNDKKGDTDSNKQQS